jgi:hypothetical protein
MQLHDLLHEREPDSTAFMCSALTVLHSIESLKQPREGVRGNTDARITNHQHHAILVVPNRQCNVTVKRMFKCVAEQVEDHLFPQRSIDIDRFRQGGAVDVEGQADPFESGAKPAGQVCAIGGQI